MMKLETKVYETRAEFDLLLITDDVKEFVKNSGIRNGLLALITQHTTTSIMVQESLPCLENDIEEKLDELVPRDRQYAHNHFLPTYGATGGNCPGHLKSMLCGNHCIFPIQNGELVLGHAQDIYFGEFDGIQRRSVFFEALGD